MGEGQDAGPILQDSRVEEQIADDRPTVPGDAVDDAGGMNDPEDVVIAHSASRGENQRENPLQRSSSFFLLLVLIEGGEESTVVFVLDGFENVLHQINAIVVLQRFADGRLHLQFEGRLPSDEGGEDGDEEGSRVRG